MNADPVVEVLDTSSFMYFGEGANRARQQHISAAVEFELAEAALHRAATSIDVDPDELAMARGHWIAAMAKLRDATVYYLQTLSDGLAHTPHNSLEDLIQHYMEVVE